MARAEAATEHQTQAKLEFVTELGQIIITDWKYSLQSLRVATKVVNFNYNSQNL
jgi:hypothetical protein